MQIIVEEVMVDKSLSKINTIANSAGRQETRISKVSDNVA